MNCEFCNKECKSKNSCIQHQLRCKSNPDRISTYSENWTDDRKLKHSLIMKKAHNNSNRIWSIDTLKGMSDRSTEFNKRYWTDDQRQKHSELMKNVVKNNIDSYSIKNVSGRVKTISYNGFDLKGSWELLVAKWLDSNNVKWTNKTNGFEYNWNDSIHIYFPDFYLPDYDIFIEVKGYERYRDRCKWNNFPKHLLVFKLKEINLIKLDRLPKEILAGWTGDGSSWVS